MDLSTLLMKLLGGAFTPGTATPASNSGVTPMTANPRAPLIDLLHSMIGLPTPSQQAQQAAAAQNAQQFGQDAAIRLQQSRNLVSPHTTYNA